MWTKKINFDSIDHFFNLEDIDLIVKFLYVRAKIENHNYDFYKKMYEKSILRFFGWVNDGKNTIPEFIESFDTLIESIEESSYDKNYPIILSKDGMILNGRHRLAVCQYLKVEPHFNTKDDFGHKRFQMDLHFYKNVFSDYEVETIIVDYVNHFKNEDYFMSFLWSDCESQWRQIEDTLKKQEISISYEKIFHFKHETYFKNVLEWIYTYENGIKWNAHIFSKAEGLKKNMKFKLLVFKYTWKKTYRSVKIGFPICREVEKIKFWIRQNLSAHAGKKNYSFLHTSDNYDHTRYLCNFLFNDNISLLKKIPEHNKYLTSTEKYLLQFETFLKKNNAERYDFCFESGIMMQIFWIRAAADLDFICLGKLREKLNFFIKNIDLHESGRFYEISKMTDDSIIKNRENFFFYKGYKFISPHLLIKNSSHLSKKKSIDMNELKKLVNSEVQYKSNLLYKIKVFLLLRYYWCRRRVLNILMYILTKRQKDKIKIFLNKYFGQNYSLDYE